MIHYRGKTEERNQIIRNLHAQGKDGFAICQELDKRTVPTIPALQKMGIHKWARGWEDKETRRSIQSVFAKQRSRREPVKS